MDLLDALNVRADKRGGKNVKLRQFRVVSVQPDFPPTVTVNDRGEHIPGVNYLDTYENPKVGDTVWAMVDSDADIIIIGKQENTGLEDTIYSFNAGTRFSFGAPSLQQVFADGELHNLQAHPVNVGFTFGSASLEYVEAGTPLLVAPETNTNIRFSAPSLQSIALTSSNQYFTNFNNDTVGQLPTGWSQRAGTGFSVRDTGATGSSGKHLRLVTGANAGDRFLSWAVADNQPDVEIVVRCMFEGASINNEMNGIYTRSAASTHPSYEATYSKDPSQNFIVVSRTNSSGTWTPLQYSNTGAIANAGQWYQMRFRVNGNRLRLRIWADNATEPTTWPIDVTNNNITSGLYNGIGAFVENRTYRWDWVGIGINGETAPKAPVGSGPAQPIQNLGTEAIGVQYWFQAGQIESPGQTLDVPTNLNVTPQAGGLLYTWNSPYNEFIVEIEKEVEDTSPPGVENLSTMSMGTTFQFGPPTLQQVVSDPTGYNPDGVRMDSFSATTSGNVLTVNWTVGTNASRTFEPIVVALRNSAGANMDFGHQYNSTVNGSRSYTASTNLANGNYTVWIAYNLNGVWTDLNQPTVVTVQGSGSGSDPVAGTPSANPPIPGNWALEFDEQWNQGIRRNIWNAESNCLRDGRGNRMQNSQLEYNSFYENCWVENGIMIIECRRESRTWMGINYPWTGGLLTTGGWESKPNVDGYEWNVAAGDDVYIEERVRVSGERGFWPSFWTWKVESPRAPLLGGDQEVDVWEHWTGWDRNGTREWYNAGTHGTPGSNTGVVYYAQHGDTISTDWNTVGARINRNGTTFYLNGKVVRQINNALTGPACLILNNWVWQDIPPVSGVNSHRRYSAWVRVWKLGAPVPIYQTVPMQLMFPIEASANPTYVDGWDEWRDGGTRRHRATDIYAPFGTPVYAATDGVIDSWMPGINQPVNIGSGGGYQLRVNTHDGRLRYQYAHFGPSELNKANEAFAPGIVPGVTVSKGDLLGWVGTSGSTASGPHLHFEIRDLVGAVTDDPYANYDPARRGFVDGPRYNPYPSLIAADATVPSQPTPTANAELGAFLGSDFQGRDRIQSFQNWINQ